MSVTTLENETVDCVVCPESDSPAQAKESLTRVLDLICRDSRMAPQRYLDETLVPHGGE
jgi:hypothetical protein